jgi:hypothetical protein
MIVTLPVGATYKVLTDILMTPVKRFASRKNANPLKLIPARRAGE